MPELNRPETVSEILRHHSSALVGPRFQLTMKSGRRLLYFPHISYLSWEDTGRPIDLSHLGLTYEGRQPSEALGTSPDRPVGKAVRPSVVKISLGFKCNYTCSYCSQAAHRMDKEPIRKPDQIKQLVDLLVCRIEQREDPISFELWGGEPFAYWEQFKLLTILLKQKFPKAQLKTVSNGTLLNDERIDFLEEYDYSIGISHDGPGYALRGRDPLDVPHQREALRKLVRRLSPRHKVNFNCVLTSNNYSLKEIYESIRDRIGQEIFLSTEGLVSHYDPTRPHFGPGRFDDMRRIWRTIHSDLMFKEADGKPLLLKLSTALMDVNKLFRSLSESRQASSLGQKCGMDLPGYWSVDMDGRLTTCQNVSADNGHQIGTLQELDQAGLTTAKHWAHHPNCRSCPVVQLCQGSCMYLDGKDRRPTCDGHFTFFLGTFAAALEYATGEQLDEILGERVRIEGETVLNF